MLTLVAKESAPAFLAVALPRLLAGAVKASWITDTVITVLSTEAYSAPGDTEHRGVVSDAWDQDELVFYAIFIRYQV